MTELEFARKLGFEDYGDLMAVSRVIAHEKGNDVQWYITKLPDGRWASWDDAELDLVRVEFSDTMIEALQNVYSGLVSSGYNCTDEPVVEKYRVSVYQEDERWVVEAYGHRYYASPMCQNEDEAILDVLNGGGEHDPTCCNE